MPTALRNVRFQGQSGKHVLASSFSVFDPTRTFATLPDQFDQHHRFLASTPIPSSGGFACRMNKSWPNHWGRWRITT
jgi:hypothetical protein